MTIKEKAKELVDKFKKYSYNGACEENDGEMEFYSAKQCALICVDEILDVLKNIEFSYTDTSFEYELNNWKDIKKEIELL